jgi:hypothetical protein
MKIESFLIASLLTLSLTACGDKLEVKHSTTAPTTDSAATTNAATAVPTIEAVNVTSTQLFDEYKANEAAFNEKIKGKVLITSGEVSGIDKISDEVFVVHLKTADELTEAHFYMSSIAKDEAAALKAGSKTKISCPKMGLDLGSPKGEDCTLVK